MTFTNKTEADMTVASVTKELADLETYYRNRKKKLKAMLGVLQDEAATAKPADAARKGATDGE